MNTDNQVNLMNNAEIARENANKYLQENKLKLYLGIIHMITAISKQGRRSTELVSISRINNIDLAPYFDDVNSTSMVQRITPELAEIIVKLKEDGFIVYTEYAETNTRVIRILW